MGQLELVSSWRLARCPDDDERAGRVARSELLDSLHAVGRWWPHDPATENDNRAKSTIASLTTGDSVTGDRLATIVTFVDEALTEYTDRLNVETVEFFAERDRAALADFNALAALLKQEFPS